MKTITIKGLAPGDLEIYAAELNTYILNLSAKLPGVRNTDRHLSDLMLMDIAQNLYYNWGKKVFVGKQSSTFSIKVFEAIVLVQIIVDSKHERDTYAHWALEKLKTELHSEIINL